MSFASSAAFVAAPRTSCSARLAMGVTPSIVSCAIEASRSVVEPPNSGEMTVFDMVFLSVLCGSLIGFDRMLSQNAGVRTLAHRCGATLRERDNVALLLLATWLDMIQAVLHRKTAQQGPVARSRRGYVRAGGSATNERRQ